jgi:pyruvate dehydrogenase E2 component (dihydrolipoamide acetyltransferase)
MPFSVVMPALEMGQETGKLVAWRKNEGEPVIKGEPLLEVETDKAVLEVEAPADGVLAGIKAREGAVIPVGQTIAWIVGAGEGVPAEAPVLPSTKIHGSSAQLSATLADAQSKTITTSPRISPKARRLAKERGVDINTVKGTAADGEIQASDIEATAIPKVAFASPAAQGESAPLSATARLMAERTTQSWTTVPHFFLVREVDATRLNEAREILGPQVQTGRGRKVTHTDLLVALVARTLVRHPRMNASWDGTGIRLNPKINIGIAMAVVDGVVVAVIPNADSAKLSEIAAQRDELSERARGKKLRPSDIANATFTISNLGMYQVDAFTAVIIPPQAAILAVGRITDRVVAIEGRPEIRPMMTLTLACDHRVVDGAQAALFLQDLAESIRAPRKSLS